MLALPAPLRRSLAAVAAIAAACGGEPVEPPALVPVASVSLAPPDPVVGVRATAPLTVSVRGPGGVPLRLRDIAWASADPAVATVDSAGVVTGVAPGTTEITATAGGRTGRLTLTVSPVAVASVRVEPATLTLAPGDSAALVGTALDAGGAPLPRRVFAWSSSAPAVATVSPLGVVTAVAAGSAAITGTSEGRSAAVAVTVVVPAVVSVTVAPDSVDLGLGDSLALTATPRDSAGRPVAGRPVAWRSSDTTRASVSPAGLVRARGPGAVTITATVDGTSGTAAVIVKLRFRSVSAGADFSCGATPAGTAFCWGRNAAGALGDGTATDRAEPVAVAMPAGVRFDSVSAGQDHTCGVTPEGAVYCWGGNTFGQLGTGDLLDRRAPAPVRAPSGVRFSNVSAAARFTCARATTDVVYCWGLNQTGQLGNAQNAGTANPNPLPLPVAGGPFGSVGATQGHACAIGRRDGFQGLVFCWGANESGQLGRGGGTDPGTSVPAPIQGFFRYLTVSAGFRFSCGVQADDSGWCWGLNSSGELGTATAGTVQTAPVQVNTSVRFAAISAGQALACGVDLSGTGYCWGSNQFGQLGIGSDAFPVTPPGPRPVAGGLSFAQIDAGVAHACGVTTAGIAYCWGRAQDGTAPGASALGNGASANRNAPVKVAGQP